MAMRERVVKQCTRILFQLENDNNDGKNSKIDYKQYVEKLKERYGAYKIRKQENNETVIPYHEFVALCAITAENKSNTPFVFENAKLSFSIMCNQSESSQQSYDNTVTYPQFKKWATKLYPLATKQNLKRVFNALAVSPVSYDDNNSNSDNNDDSNVRFPRLRKLRKSSNNSNNSNDGNESTIYSGIKMSQFCEYVSELRANFNIEERECQGMKSSLEHHISPHERLLYHTKGVSDMTGLPPYYGFVIMTDVHLIFQGSAITTRTTCIKLSDSKLSVSKAKIGGFLKRDTALRVVCEKGTFTWNIVQIKATKRDQLFWSIQTMLNAHKLVSNVKKSENENNVIQFEKKAQITSKIERKIVMEASDDILRQNALHTVFEKIKKDGKPFDAIPFVRYASESELLSYVTDIRSGFRSIEDLTNKINNSTSTTSILSSMYNSLTHGSSSLSQKEETLCYIDPVRDIELKKYKKLEKDTKLNNTITLSHRREEFDVKIFLKHLKVLRIQIEPLIFLIRFYKCLRRWKNPGLSLSVVLVLLFIGYFEYLYYIPSVILLLNSALLISFRKDKISNKNDTLDWCDSALQYAGFDPDDDDEEKKIADAFVAKKYGKTLQNKEIKNKWQIIHRIKKFRNDLVAAKFSMGFHQKRLSDLSMWLGRFRAIYKWNLEDKSQIYCILSAVIAFLILFVKFNYVFMICVFAIFFKHCPFRKRTKTKGIVDRYFESIPPDIPVVDDDEDNDESGDSDDNSDDDDGDDSEYRNLKNKEKNGKLRQRIKERRAKKLKMKTNASNDNSTSVTNHDHSQ